MTNEPIPETKDRPGSYDAIEAAKPGEPLFAIQGGDPFGPATVLHWASLARDAALATTDDKVAERLLRKATDAELVAWNMQAYQRGHVEPEGDGRARYNDAPMVEREDQPARSEREARIKGAARLHDLVGRGAELVETLGALGVCHAEVDALTDCLDLIKTLAAAIEPRRENERS